MPTLPGLSQTPFAIGPELEYCYDMKARTVPCSAGIFLALFVLVGLLVSGCASTKVNWADRVGTFTYDQAITELGPPDKQATLSDGRTVATWITGYTGGTSIGFGVGSYGSHSAVGVGHSVGSGGREKTLQLTFDQDGKLAEWAKR